MSERRFGVGDKVWSKKDRGMTLHDGDHRRPSCWVVRVAHPPRGDEEWKYDVALRSDIERKALFPNVVRGVWEHRLNPWEGE